MRRERHFKLKRVSLAGGRLKRMDHGGKRGESMFFAEDTNWNRMELCTGTTSCHGSHIRCSLEDSAGIRQPGFHQLIQLKATLLLTRAPTTVCSASLVLSLFFCERDGGGGRFVCVWMTP